MIHFLYFIFIIFQLLNLYIFVFLDYYFKFIVLLVEYLIKFSVYFFVDVFVDVSLVDKQMGRCKALYKLVYDQFYMVWMLN